MGGSSADLTSHGDEADGASREQRGVVLRSIVLVTPCGRGWGSIQRADRTKDLLLVKTSDKLLRKDILICVSDSSAKHCDMGQIGIWFATFQIELSEIPKYVDITEDLANNFLIETWQFVTITKKEICNRIQNICDDLISVSTFHERNDEKRKQSEQKIFETRLIKWGFTSREWRSCFRKPYAGLMF